MGHQLDVRGTGWQSIEHCRSLPEKSKQKADERGQYGGHEDPEYYDQRGKSYGSSHCGARRRG